MDIENKFIDLLNAIEKNDHSFFGLNIKNKTKVAEKQTIFHSNNNVLISVAGTGKSVFSEAMAIELLLLKKEKVIDNIEKIKKFKEEYSDSKELLDLTFSSIYTELFLDIKKSYIDVFRY